MLVALHDAGNLLAESLPRAAEDRADQAPDRTDATTRRLSTGTSATTRPWKPCTRPVGCLHTGHGSGSSRVRADTRMTSPSSVTPSTTRADSPENTTFTSSLT